MPERKVVRLPEKNRTSDFYANFTVTEYEDKIVVNEGWIYAPRRGNEIMKLIKNFFSNLAKSRNKKVVHQFEASTLAGKKLAQKNEEYRYKERTSDGNTLYEGEYDP